MVEAVHRSIITAMREVKAFAHPGYPLTPKAYLRTHASPAVVGTNIGRLGKRVLLLKGPRLKCALGEVHDARLCGRCE